MSRYVRCYVCKQICEGKPVKTFIGDICSGCDGRVNRMADEKIKNGWKLHKFDVLNDTVKEVG